MRALPRTRAVAPRLRRAAAADAAAVLIAAFVDLLDANPLDSVANLDRIWAVAMTGKVYTRSALDKLLAGVATYDATQPFGAVAHALEAPVHTDWRMSARPDRAWRRYGLATRIQTIRLEPQGDTT